MERSSTSKYEVILLTVFLMIFSWQDRGLQIGWTTVFLSEYAGPMFVYLWFYTRPWLAYGALDADTPALSTTAHIAAAAWSVKFPAELN